jgi:hypothetical protein
MVVKWPEPEADYALSFSTEAKKIWSYTFHSFILLLDEKLKLDVRRLVWT